MREQVGSQGGQVTVAQLPAKACPILSCTPPPPPRSWRRAEAQRVHGECARRARTSQFEERAQGRGCWIALGMGSPSERTWSRPADGGGSEAGSEFPQLSESGRKVKSVRVSLASAVS